MPPGRKVAVVACMDARIDVYRALGLGLGEAHVIRNAGGVVSDDAVKPSIVDDTGLRPSFALESFADVDVDVAQSIARVKANPFIPNKNVRGFVYDVDTGALREVTG